MQLQIQRTANQSFDQGRVGKIDFQRNGFIKYFNQPKQHIIPTEVQSKLRQIRDGAKADHYFLIKLKGNTFFHLSQQNYQAQLTLLQKCFVSLKENFIEQKVSYVNKRVFLHYLNLNLQNKKAEKQKVKSSIVFRNQHLMRTSFEEWYLTWKITKDYQQISVYLKRLRSKQFLQVFKERGRVLKYRKIQHQQTCQAVDKIHSLNQLKKYFAAFRLHSKIHQFQKYRKYRYLNQLKIRVFSQKEKLQKLLAKHKYSSQWKCKRLMFDVLRQNSIHSNCLDWHKYRLCRVYFNTWRQQIFMSLQEKEIQDSNQIILKHFREAREEKDRSLLPVKYFKMWSLWLVRLKENRKEEQILQQFSLMKEREYLQRKYFGILKLHVRHEKANKFHSKKLKSKAMETLKRNLIASARKLLNLYNFIQNRSYSKYFQRIKLFIGIQNQKVEIFKKKQAWNKFTLRIALQYLRKCEKAKQYCHTSLLFKSMICFKENVQVGKKSDFCAYYVNICLVFKRWVKRFRVRKFCQLKEQVSLKQSFFLWKVFTVKKLGTGYLSDFSQSNQFLDSQILESERYDQQMRDGKKHQFDTKQNDSSSKKIQVKQNKLVFSSQNKLFKSEQLEKESERQTSFFEKLHEDTSQNDDQIERKISSLLKQIKGKQKVSKKSLQRLTPSKQQHFSAKNIHQQSIQQSSQAEIKDCIGKQFSSKNKNSLERIRAPTWSSPGTQFKTSVFEQQY